MASSDFMKKLKAAMQNTTHCPTKNPNEQSFRTADSAWKPMGIKNRVQIIVTGNPSRIGVVANAVDALQDGLLGGKKNTEIRITSFLDGCAHHSDWSSSPSGAASASRRWHCHESRTLFADTLRQAVNQNVDVIVILGSRFDDKFDEVMRQAEELKKQGTKVIALQVGDAPSVATAFKSLAEITGGAHIALTDQSSIAEAMPIIMEFVEKGTLADLRLPDSPDMRLLISKLEPAKFGHS